MGGCKIIPDIPLDSIRPEEAAVFILPGGDMWEQGPHEDVIECLHLFQGKDTIIAAICGATLEVARAGLMHGRRHTSNSRGYLKAMLPDYRDGDFYIDKPAVTDKNLITASGLGSIEFAYEMLRQLSIYTREEADELYEMFKLGIIPARYAI